MKARFSVIVLCYRRFEYLYSAVDSVLKQDYPNVELVVSDDGSPNFPREEIETYIQQHRGPNITSVLVRQQKQNSGTVKHLNDAIQDSSGTYVAALAGDDILYDEQVITKYVQGFMNAPENCYVQMAQTAMYDEDLETFQSYYMTPVVQRAVENTKTDSSQLLRLLLTKGACLPSTSTCFKKEFFARFGRFDESYVLVEDYPTHVRLAEEGWIIHCENFIAIKHRHGGISHGQKDTLSRSAILYLNDDRRMVSDIILKKSFVLSEEERKQAKIIRKKQMLWTDYMLAKSQHGIAGVLVLGLKHPGYGWAMLMDWSWRWAFAWYKKLGVLCVAMWLTNQIVAQILSVAFGVETEATSRVLYCISAGVGFVWLVSIFMWIATKFTWAVKRFPDEVRRIG